MAKYLKHMNLSIIIPAYNECAHIERVVRDIHHELQKIESDFEIIVVDNGSVDNTKTVLAVLQSELSRLCVRHVFPNRGYGGGILEGLSVSQGEIIGWTDGDGQVGAKDLREMYEKMKQEDLVFIKARRMIRHDGTFRAIQSRIYNIIFWVFFSSRISDTNAKPKLFRRSFFDKIQLTSTDLFIDAEIIIQALRLGVPVSEHPIIFESRKGGASKIRVGAGIEFIKNLLYHRFFR